MGTADDSLIGSVAGNADDRGRMMGLIYDNLRKLAQARMRNERADHTLQPTALVHEAFLRLIDQDRVNPGGRTHFFALAARSMRRVLVDHARSKQTQKRGAAWQAEDLDECDAVFWDDPSLVIDLDEALAKLGKAQPRQSRVVELRFFGGLSLAETAEALGVSRDTVKLDWRFARAWLNRQMADRAD